MRMHFLAPPFRGALSNPAAGHRQMSGAEDSGGRHNLARGAYRLRLTTAVSTIMAAAAWCAPQAARAACTTPVEGGTVVCTGTVDAPPFTVQDFTRLTVDVQGANFNTAFDALRIGTLVMTSTGNLQNATFIDIGSLNLALNGGNINGVINIDGVGTLVMTSVVNLPNTTFTDVGSLNLAITGGNVNGTVRVVRGGTVEILNQVNANRFLLDVSNRLVFQNSGNINNGLSITGAGDTEVTNSGQINTTFDITGDGHHQITNTNTINSGIVLNSDGSSSIINLAGATINSRIQSTGSSTDTVDNSGVIQGSTFDLGAGNDLVINRPTSDPQLGRIDSDVNLGDDDDALLMLGGLIRRVNAGSGNDMASIEGGTIDDRYSGQDGNDNLTWRGGQVRNVDMGAGTDTALFSGLTSTSLDFLASASGGLGAGDTLTFSNTAASGPHRFTLWERVELKNNSSLTLGGGTLTLGDSGTASGQLSIDASSTLFAGGGHNFVRPFTTGQPVTVTNEGVVDLTNGPPSTSDRLTIAGNYVGVSGRLNSTPFSLRTALPRTSCG